MLKNEVMLREPPSPDAQQERLDQVQKGHSALLELDGTVEEAGKIAEKKFGIEHVKPSDCTANFLEYTRDDRTYYAFSVTVNKVKNILVGEVDVTDKEWDSDITRIISAPGFRAEQVLSISMMVDALDQLKAGGLLPNLSEDYQSIIGASDKP